MNAPTLQAEAPIDVRTHPLFLRLLAQPGHTAVSEAEFDAYRTQPGHTLLVFTEDPVRFKETLDVVVIAPEIAAAFPGRFRVGVLLPDAARALHARYGFMRWPALVMLRDGQYVGAIDGLRDWDEYLREVTRLLAAEPTRPPAIGIPVAGGAASNCHH